MLSRAGDGGGQIKCDSRSYLARATCVTESCSSRVISNLVDAHVKGQKTDDLGTKIYRVVWLQQITH